MERQAQQRGGGFTVTPLMRGVRANSNTSKDLPAKNGVYGMPRFPT